MSHSDFGKSARRVAFCGLMGGLGAALLCFGSFIPMATFCCPIFAMVTLLPARIRFGQSAAWTQYAVIAALGVLLAVDKEAAGLFVAFGCYPMLKPRFDRLRSRGVRLLCKLAYFNLTAGALYAVLIWVLGLQAVAQAYADATGWLMALMLGTGNLIFFTLDRLLVRLNARCAHYFHHTHLNG